MSDSRPARKKRTTTKRAGTYRKRSGMKLRTFKGTTRTPNNDKEE